MEKTAEKRVELLPEGQAVAEERAGALPTPPARRGLFAMVGEAMRRRRGKGWELALDLLYGALACALSLTHGLFGVYPFALGLLAATPRRMLPCFLGAALGCYFMGRVGLLYLCVYGAVLLFRLLLSYPFKRRRLPSPALFSEEPALRVLVAASAGLGMAVYELAVGGIVTYTLLFALGAILLPSLACFFYIGALDYGESLFSLLGKGERSKGNHSSRVFFCLSALVSLYTVALSLMKQSLFGLSLGVAAGAAVTLLASRRFGALWGCAVGLAVGLAGAPLYIPSFCLLGLLSGVLWQVSMPCALSAAAVAAGGWAVYAGGLSGFLAVTPEVAATSLLLWPLLHRLPRSEGEAEPLPEGEKQEDEAATARLSTALYNLSGIKESFEEESEEGYFLLAARAAERHCRPCKGGARCAARKEGEALLSHLAEALYRGEPFSEEDKRRIEGLSAKCDSFPTMLRDLETSAALLEERRHRSPLRALLLSDYALFSRMLSELSGRRSAEAQENEAEARALTEALEGAGYRVEGVRVSGRRKKKITLSHLSKGGRAVSAEALRLLCEEVVGVPLTSPTYRKEGKSKPVYLEGRPRLSARVAYATAAKTAGEPSGDALRSFENADGFYYTLLCDGMGTGREAARAADSCAYFLSELLKAGNRMQLSLRMLNNFIRAEGEEGAVTVDLCQVDIYGGSATFLKSGAAPSFLKRGGSLFRIRSRTVPLGLFGSPDSERVNVEVEAGDRIVLLSDGIVEKEESEALRQALLAEGLDIREQAEAILAAAEEGDDRSVAVIELSSAP